VSDEDSHGGALTIDNRGVVAVDACGEEWDEQAEIEDYNTWGPEGVLSTGQLRKGGGCLDVPLFLYHGSRLLTISTTAFHSMDVEGEGGEAPGERQKRKRKKAGRFCQCYVYYIM
jgi:hypothetical protein